MSEISVDHLMVLGDQLGEAVLQYQKCYTKWRTMVEYADEMMEIMSCPIKPPASRTELKENPDYFKKVEEWKKANPYNDPEKAKQLYAEAESYHNTYLRIAFKQVTKLHKQVNEEIMKLSDEDLIKARKAAVLHYARNSIFV